jgi:peptide/nickel transport system ATP-binding protein
MQMIFQDPYASLNPRWRVADIIAEPIRAHGLAQGPSDVKARVAALLEQVGLAPADGAKFPHQFSGGQRQRISIARALATRPAFLICDEPTSALDVSVQAQVLNLMRRLQRELGLTYLFISHNLAVVHHVADRVGVMYLGRIVELAPTRRLFASPQHPYTRMLLAAIPDLTLAGKPRTAVGGEVPNPLDPPSGCAFHPRCPHANERCRRELPLLRTVAGAAGEAVACHAVEEGRLAPAVFADA